MTRPDGPRGIQSIETGYRVLTAVQGASVAGAVPLKEIARIASITVSAAHNYLVSFIRTGMVAADGRGHYRLGPSLVSLGMAALKNDNHFDAVQTAALALHEKTGLGVAISVWSDFGPVVLFKKDSLRRGSFSLRTGPVELFTTASGNIFIAYLDRQLVLPVAARDGNARNMTLAQRTQELHRIGTTVRSQGFARQQLSDLQGYTALSVPIWAMEGELVYALSLTGLTDEVDISPNGTHIFSLLNYGHMLSRQFGAPASFWADALGRAADRAPSDA